MPDVCRTDSAEQPGERARLLQNSPSVNRPLLLAPTSSLQSAASESFSITFETLDQPEAPLRKRIADELRRQTQLAGPLFVQNALAYSTTVVAIAFVGHLSDPALLSACVLANSLYNVTGASLLSGLASGMESLCGQAYGARSYKALGVVLQRALLVTWLTCLPITLLWLHSERLLLLLGQQPSIAAGASLYLRLITPALYFGALVECLKRYLLAQRVVVPGMVVTAATCLLGPLYNYLLLFRLNLGLSGAALAFSASQGTTALLLLLYTVWRDASMAAAGHEEATWSAPGWHVLSGSQLLNYLSFGLPATVQLCSEWWMYEVAIFMAGIIPNAELGQGVMGLLFQISACAYMSALAYGSSVNTRVSNELGAGNGQAARLSVFTCLAALSLVQSLLAVACRLADRLVVGVLSNSSEVQQLTISVFPLLLPTFVADAINCMCQGVLRGAGRPGVGAVLNSVGYWGLGVPLAAFFGLHQGWGVHGFWAGLLATSCTMAVVQLLVIARFDWGDEVARAAAMLAASDYEAGGGGKAAVVGVADGALAQAQAGSARGSGGSSRSSSSRGSSAAGDPASSGSLPAVNGDAPAAGAVAWRRQGDAAPDDTAPLLDVRLSRHGSGAAQGPAAKPPRSASRLSNAS